MPWGCPACPAQHQSDKVLSSVLTKEGSVFTISLWEVQDIQLLSNGAFGLLSSCHQKSDKAHPHWQTRLLEVEK